MMQVLRKGEWTRLDDATGTARGRPVSGSRPLRLHHSRYTACGENWSSSWNSRGRPRAAAKLLLEMRPAPRRVSDVSFAPQPAEASARSPSSVTPSSRLERRKHVSFSPQPAEASEADVADSSRGWPHLQQQLCR